eukprot:711075-Hanusia_phi.AAC.1
MGRPDPILGRYVPPPPFSVSTCLSLQFPPPELELRAAAQAGGKCASSSNFRCSRQAAAHR